MKIEPQRQKQTGSTLLKTTLKRPDYLGEFIAALWNIIVTVKVI